MSNQLSRACSDFARRKAGQSAAWVTATRDIVSGFFTTAHHALMVFGILAMAALAAMFFKPDLADRFTTLSPFAEQVEAEEDEPQIAKLMEMPKPTAVQAAVASTEDAGMIGSAIQQERVTNWLSKRYRVAADATNMLVSAAYLTAKEIKLDPLLILSVMAIESRFNPFAESPVGAQGLMQVMSKVHKDKFEDHGGPHAALNPVANIKVGSLILKDYVRRGGSVEAGLKLYVGAGNLDTDYGYGAKVLAEYRRLKDVAMGKKVSVYATTAAPMKPQKEASPVETALTAPQEAVMSDSRMAAL